MRMFLYLRVVLIVTGFCILSACTIKPPANVTGTINDLVQTASGAIGQGKAAVQNVEDRAQNVQKGFQQISSGANLIKNGLKP